MYIVKENKVLEKGRGKCFMAFLVVWFNATSLLKCRIKKLRAVLSRRSSTSLRQGHAKQSRLSKNWIKLSLYCGGVLSLPVKFYKANAQSPRKLLAWDRKTWTIFPLFSFSFSLLQNLPYNVYFLLLFIEITLKNKC